MPVVESKKEVKLKFVHLVTGVDGVQRSRTNTLSNITNGTANDTLMQGAKALISLMQTPPVAIVRADECELQESV